MFPKVVLAVAILFFALGILPSYLSLAIQLFLTRKFLTDEPPPTWYSGAQSA